MGRVAESRGICRVDQRNQRKMDMVPWAGLPHGKVQEAGFGTEDNYT